MSAHSSEAVHAAMRTVFPEAEEHVQQFYAMQEYHLGWRDAALNASAADSGKLIRPRLCTLACQATGGKPEQALPLAAALQLLHDFTLIHDDIEDASPTRRGRETVWQLWGVPQAINAGDGMFVLAQLSVLRLLDVGVEAATVVELSRRFNDMVVRICEGQYLDMTFETRLDITESDYLGMISRKTATLIASATGLGAILGQGTAEHCKQLYRFGEALGLAFQIEDDILGIWGLEAATGKPEAHDIWGRKKSLPIIHALSHAEPAEREELLAIYEEPELTQAQVDTVRAALDRSGSRGYTAGVARFYHEEALTALDALADLEPGAIAELRQITTQLLGRAR